MSLIFLLMFARIAWSFIEEDIEYSGVYRSVYLKSLNGPYLYYITLPTQDLYQAYACTQEFRKVNLPNSVYLDFDELANVYASCRYTSRYGNWKIGWVELYGNKDELKTYPSFKDLRLHLVMKDVKFSKQNPDSIKNVEIILQNIIDRSKFNTGSTLEVKHTVERISKSTTTGTQVHYAPFSQLGSDINYRNIGSYLNAILYERDFREGQESDPSSISYNLTDEFSIPANKTGRLIWMKSENYTELDWSAYIEVTGWIAVKNTKYEIFFYPVEDMAYIFSEYVTRLGPNRIALKVSGTLRILDEITSDAVIDEFDLTQTDNRCPTELINYTLPQSLIIDV